tara:strand:- start:192 stop:677 length:486 start_codon:yes stop_codon:yes gene_type:complete
MKIFFKAFFILFFTAPFLHAENKWSLYTGMFDFSDDGKRANLFGAEYINFNASKDIFLGNVQPVIGGMITADDALYIYTGYQLTQKSNSTTFSPSFSVGYYDEGDGKDLGHEIEFKTQIQILFDISSNSELGISYNHISNASLGNKNPGANSYMFNFIKKF